MAVWLYVICDVCRARITHDHRSVSEAMAEAVGLGGTIWPSGDGITCLGCTMKASRRRDGQPVGPGSPPMAS